MIPSLNILQYPDSRLRKVAKPVKLITSEIKDLVRNMFKIMYEKRGIGLAATQVNIHQRIVVINISQREKKDELTLINPIILSSHGVISLEERCLSVSNRAGCILRSKFIEVKTKSLSGKEFIFHAKGLLSVCIQHEVDHLDGKLFIDYLRK
ncbi:peptide deformylase [Candidatus Riesia pediculicola]|uniref:peptide deformylase n=1 Tax=Candidatus Riesia pediculicola TaxID=401619 RepID=UPI00178CA27B|nr:peptide deformylase [Candidatus Riesia pediculicola]QOJ86516.1 peptide deformylase [Candidatus Riesia pediculicola]